MIRTNHRVARALLIVIFILAVGVANWMVFQWVKADTLQNWELYSQNVVAGIDPTLLAQMQARASDEDLESYTYLRNQLFRAAEIGAAKHVEWLYLMKIDNESVRFTIDSIPETSPDHAVPGEEYVSYPPELLEAQTTKKLQLVENYIDEWGNYLSIFVPVVDWNSGEVVGVFGLDVERSVYLTIMAQKMAWPVSISLVLGGLLFMFAMQLESKRTLKENDLLLHVLTEGVFDAIAMIDEQGLVVLWNKTAEKILGRSESDVKGKNLLQLLSLEEESASTIWNDLQQLLESTEVMSKSTVFETRARRANKEWFDVELLVSVVGSWGKRRIIVIIRDVTEKKKENLELVKKNREIDMQRTAILNVLEDVSEEKEMVKKHAEELRKFQTALNQSNEMTVFTDADGVVLWGNPAVEKITGYTLKEAAGKKAGQLWGGYMGEKWYENLWRRIKVEKKMFSDLITNHRKNGEKFISAFTVYPLLDGEGEVKIFVATQRDVTREQEIDRMKTDFISLASHQLRTPLSAMKWFLEMLLAGDMGKLSKEQKDAINNVDKSNERMIALVNALLNVSRIESGRIIVEPELLDVVGLAEMVADELKESFKLKQQKLIISANGHLPKIKLDQKLTRQVFLNLLTNANKYTPKKGEIVVFISKKGEEIVVQVSDNGYGIPKEDEDKIFERFFRAANAVKQETDGTGLGLYLVKAIVESSGGKIWFKSKINSGTSFWFTLPLKGVKPKAGEVRLS